ncbi:MAG: 4Fe-4S dicluster domain-containing protein [Atopobiaceae bacterium]|jgi:[FeFe] hydrogenase (group B1/B3)|nr:4Fe-4S dicluster domain-containing protein [Atopobiaceae bacterium]MCH4179857.1 4Fe-4S dicluster domain-containing protein [Atopobiaceae bacterium]MCH4213608.1 4Fe-4S dicluster domain-containing protein [Atopobiaceae bacterium]MCH4229613.1 4Fe-4S dicluster domain-containing protein [Atopobiaceae bacterium]MCH4276256.1 4Fe-4S dicluster domain-containing protein [Atopobiaceae bacterium]
MSDTMRGVYTNLTRIRRQVFREVARLAYSNEGDDYSWVDELPYQIIPGDVATYRESVFLERAIVGERVRLAMGLPLQGVDKPQKLSDGIAEAAKPETYYQPPLINIIKFACNACEDNSYVVTDQCQGCLAHPCRESCPRGAIEFIDKKAHIHHEECIKCGKCAKVCPYGAIMHRQRPCAAACGMHAITSDEQGRAEIDYDKCVSCGMCLVNCPFGAIADKSQLFQVIKAIQAGDEVIAAVAPAFVGQYGGKGDVGNLKAAFKALGFAGVEEVAVGADLCTIQEAEDFMDEVPSKQPFMGTSCCPAWSVMAKKEFPEQADCISMALTPMTLTARLIRELHPDAKIVFVGPCAAKKLEAMRKTVRSEVDFVLTFEEVAAMLDAKDIDYLALDPEDKSDFANASADGRGFAVSGGVASAVVNAIHRKYPDREVKVMSAEGLDDCRKMMKDACKGKLDGYLLEGMACPGGCVAGAGTLQSIVKSTVMVNMYKKRAKHKNATDDAYRTTVRALVAENERGAADVHAADITADKAAGPDVEEGPSADA